MTRLATPATHSDTKPATISHIRGHDPFKVGATGLLMLGVLLVTGFRAGDLPLIGGSDVFYAEFTEIGGLKLNDPVLVAGVRVGNVESIELTNARVRVGFRLTERADLGAETRAAVKIKTLLGAMYLALEPSGSGTLRAGDVIPISRTTPPFEVIDAFTGLAERSASIDTDQLAASLRTLADVTRETPRELRAALAGIAELSDVVASRNKEIGRLLQNLRRVSETIDERDEDLVAFMDDADELFRALLTRRAAVHRVLVATSDLSQTITSLIQDSRTDLAPALQHLDSVLQVIKKNEDNLDESLRALAPFTRAFASVTGNGPWLDGYIFNVPPLP